MTIRDLDFREKDSFLKITDLENMFSVHTDRKRNLVYNLNETVCLDVDPDTMQEYVVTHDSYWPLISFKLYHTIRLAWLLLKLNSIDAEHAFDIIPAGTKINCLDKDTVNELVAELNDFN